MKFHGTHSPIVVKRRIRPFGICPVAFVERIAEKVSVVTCAYIDFHTGCAFAYVQVGTSLPRNIEYTPVGKLKANLSRSVQSVYKINVPGGSVEIGRSGTFAGRFAVFVPEAVGSNRIIWNTYVFVVAPMSVYVKVVIGSYRDIAMIEIIESNASSRKKGDGKYAVGSHFNVGNDIAFERRERTSKHQVCTDPRLRSRAEARFRRGGSVMTSCQQEQDRGENCHLPSHKRINGYRYLLRNAPAGLPSGW